MPLENTYITVEGADQYHADYNPASDWAATETALKQAAIRRATQWLESVPNWIGQVRQSDQELQWPRSVTEDENGRKLQLPFPTAVVQACAELALLALTQPILEDSKGQTISRVKADTVEVAYQEHSTARKTYPKVNSLLSALTVGSSINVNVQRVQ